MIGIYIWIPFVGTFLGAACVLFMTGELKPLVQKSLLGFASGVMVAASVWSLLIPSLEMSEEMGRLSFIPAAVGLLDSWSVLRPTIVPVIVITVLTTIIVMVVTGRVTQNVIRKGREKEENE